MNVRFDSTMNKAFYYLDTIEGPYNTGTEYKNGQSRPPPCDKGWLLPRATHRSCAGTWAAIMLAVMGDLGIEPEKHHHEVAGA